MQGLWRSKAFWTYVTSTSPAPSHVALGFTAAIQHDSHIHCLVFDTLLQDGSAYIIWITNTIKYIIFIYSHLFTLYVFCIPFKGPVVEKHYDFYILISGTNTLHACTAPICGFLHIPFVCMSLYIPTWKVISVSTHCHSRGH